MVVMGVEVIVVIEVAVEEVVAESVGDYKVQVPLRSGGIVNCKIIKDLIHYQDIFSRYISTTKCEYSGRKSNSQLHFIVLL
jgi:hypothetical protein